MKNTRKKKYVVWLNNHTDRRDDEWYAVWAKDAKEAARQCVYERNRFSVGCVYTIQEFRKIWPGNCV